MQNNPVDLYVCQDRLLQWLQWVSFNYVPDSQYNSQPVWTSHKIKGMHIKSEMNNLLSYVSGAIKIFNNICYLIKYQLVSRIID